MPELRIPSLSGGLADRLSDSVKQDNQLIICENLDVDKSMLGMVTSRPGVGSPYINLGGFKNNSGEPIQNYKVSFLFGVKRDRTHGAEIAGYKYLVIGRNYLHRLNKWGGDPDAVHGLISSEMPLGVRQVIEDDDHLYFFCNENPPKTLDWEISGTGYERNVRDFGLRFDMAGVSATASDSGGSMEAGYYAYKFIPTDEHGNMFPTDNVEMPEILNITTGSMGSVTWSGLMSIKQNTEVKLGDNLYVYRTKVMVDSNPDNIGAYYLHSVRTWSGGGSFTDTYADSSLTTVMEETGGLPRDDLRGGVLWNNRLFAYAENSPILYFSKEWNYEIFPLVNQIPIGGPDPIRAIVQRGNGLVIFKDGAVYEFFGTSKYNYNYQLVSSIHGTNKVNTVQAIDNNRIIFIDRQNRVWLYDGQFTEISLPVNIDGNTFRTAVFGRYYLVWAKNVLGEQGYTPRLQGDDYGDGDWPPDDPYWGDVAGAETRPGLPPAPGDDEPPDNDDPDTDEDDEDPIWSDELTEPFDRCYAYHIPSSRWCKFTGMTMKVVEQPTRGGEGLLLWFNGSDFLLGGDGNYADLRENLNIQSKFFMSDDYQEKRFRDIEIELFYTYDRRVGDDTPVGTVHIYTDGNISESIESFLLIYTSGKSGQLRISHRFKKPILGKSISVQIVGNNIMRWFEVRDIRLHWEPRGTPIRP